VYRKLAGIVQDKLPESLKDTLFSLTLNFMLPHYYIPDELLAGLQHPFLDHTHHPFW
jgi:hypothetical protein